MKIAGYGGNAFLHASYGFAGTASPIDGTVPLLVAPYGGITVKSAYCFTTAAVAANGSNYLAVNLLNMGTSGTAVAGTVGVGPGTAGMTGGVHQALTLTSANTKLTAGQVLTVVFDVNGTIAPKEAGIIVEYVRGVA